jgi:uncharacterized delta-60 repeat protein
MLVSPKGESFGIEVLNTPGNPTIRVYKYLSSGVFDLAYGNNGITEAVTMKYFNAALQDDGKVVVVGTVVYPYYPNIHDQVRSVRFNTNGSLDSTYGTNGVRTTGNNVNTLVYAFPAKLIKQGEEVVLFGYFASAAGRYNYDFINSYSSTSALNNYIVSPTRTNSVSYTLGYFATNKNVAIRGNNVVVAGPEAIESSTFPYNVTSGNFISKYVNGSLDPTFGNGGRVTATLPPGSYAHMSIMPTGKILIVNTVANTLSGNNDFSVTRLNEDGSADLGFNGTGIQTTDFGSNDSAVVITLQDNKFIIGGYTNNPVTGDKEFAIARYNDNGSPDSTFSEDGKQTLGMAGYSYSLEQLKISGDRLLASGSITSASGSETYKVIAAYLLKDNIVLTCPASRIVSTDSGTCAAIVNDLNAVITPAGSNAAVSYTFAGATTEKGTGSASGKIFNKGETVVTYKLNNDSTKTCSFKVTAEDKISPVITNLSASPGSILFANHKLTDVEIKYNLADNCSTVSSALTITGNEPESGLDNNDIAGDWEVIDAHHVKLRAERASGGTGRIYTVTVTATDASGNKTAQMTTVTVPKYLSGIKDVVADFLVKLISNPTQNFFTLFIQCSDNHEGVSLKVVDIFGRIVETRSNITSNGTLQFGSSYKPGIYFAEVRQGTKREVVTMIKF